MDRIKIALVEFIELVVMTRIGCIFEHLVCHISQLSTDYRLLAFLLLISSLCFELDSSFPSR